MNNSIPESNTFPHKKMAWIVWLASAAFLLFQFFLQLSSADIVTGLMKSFSLSAFGASVLASSYYYIYVTLQTPAGILIDRFGPRRLLTAGAFVCGFGCFLFSQAHHVTLAFPARLLMGTGGAFAFVGSLSLISRWFPIHRFAVMVAMAETVGMMGALFGGTLLAHLVAHFGWRACMAGAALIGVIISGLLWTIVRDNPPDTKHVPMLAGNFLGNIKFLFKNKIAWMNGFYSGLMFSVQTVFVSLWGVPFIETAHHQSLTMAAFICNLLFVGVCIGGPVLAWLDSHFAWRRQVTVAGALVSFVLISLVIYLPQLPLWVVGLLLLLLGFSCSSYVLTFVIANEIAPGYMRSTSVGFVNMLSVSSAPLLQPLVGFLMAISSHDTTGQYSVGAFQIGLSILPLAFLISAYLARYLPLFKNQ